MPLKGHKHTEEAKKKMSAARSIPQVECKCDFCGGIVLRNRCEVKRRKHTFCNRKCEAEYCKGVPRADHIRKKISDAQKGRQKTEEQKEKYRKGAKRRFENPEERERIRQFALGRVISQETKLKMKHSQKRAIENNPTINVRRLEGAVGGFWYGNVKYWYVDAPQYCEKFNREFKERVRAYRGYICFECGTPQNGKKLGIHHVHYDKKMCCNGSPKDVVPLCGSCHSETNYNREYWEQHFTEMIYAYDPSGKCFFTKEEMKEFCG